MAGVDNQVPASKFADGSLLEFLAADHLNIFRSAQLAASGCGLKAGATIVLVWGSICSGSEVMVLVLMALTCAYAELGVQLKFKHAFSCENMPAKQQWIRSLFQELEVADGCVFERAEDMGGKRAYCVKHKALCPVPSVDLLVTGTSCKDFSKKWTMC